MYISLYIERERYYHVVLHYIRAERDAARVGSVETSSTIAPKCDLRCSKMKRNDGAWRKILCT